MSTLSDFMVEETTETTDIKPKIRQRRSQMLIHSRLYYELDDSIVSDHKWQEWADDLEQLQTKYPDQCKIDFFDFEFKDWTGATGNHLPLRDPWVVAKTDQILRIHNKQKD